MVANREVHPLHLYDDARASSLLRRVTADLYIAGGSYWPCASDASHSVVPRRRAMMLRDATRRGCCDDDASTACVRACVPSVRSYLCTWRDGSGSRGAQLRARVRAGGRNRACNVVPATSCRPKASPCSVRTSSTRALPSSGATNSRFPCPSFPASPFTPPSVPADRINGHVRAKGEVLEVMRLSVSTVHRRICKRRTLAKSTDRDLSISSGRVSDASAPR